MLEFKENSELQHLELEKQKDDLRLKLQGQ